MPRKPDLPCADCGKLLWRATTSLPEGKARCHPCRRANSAAHPRECRGCGATFTVTRVNAPERYCSRACSNRHTSVTRGLVRHPTDARSSRKARERDAPGLGYAARKALRDRWKAQAKTCTYCDKPATTIDHVVPLVRGGTNHEGNLTPCCKTCNSAKAGWTVVEWRTGKRLPPMADPLPWVYDRRRSQVRKPVTGEQMVMQICDACGWADGHEVSSYECFRTKMRNRYRDRVGIPRDAPLHTRAA